MKKPMLENPNIASVTGSKERKVRILAIALSVGSSVMNVKYTMLRIDVTYKYHISINVPNLPNQCHCSRAKVLSHVLSLDAEAFQHRRKILSNNLH